MLKQVSFHSDYQAFLRKSLPPLLDEKYLSPKDVSKLLTAMWLFDCDPILPKLTSLFASDGRPARDPVSMLRSLVLMHFYGIHSITAWVEKLEFNEHLRILAGFDVDDCSSVSSYYDFINRLWQDKSQYSKHLKNFTAKPRKSDLDASGKLICKRKHGIVDRLIKKVLARRRFGGDPARFLKSFFADLAVRPSIQNGAVKTIVGDLGNVILASPIGGDGTAVETYSSSYGTKVCDCVKNGDFNCKCPRRFSDYQANWGWDSGKKQWFYGRQFYFLTAGDSELPLFLNIAVASRHDSVQGVVAFTEFNDLHPELSVPRACWDSAHDTYSFYKLHDEFGVEPFIDLKKKPSAKTKLDEYGRPICDAGLVMINCGLCNEQSRRKWRCPKMAGSRIVKETACATCSVDCSKSAYGRTIYTYPPTNIRLYNKTPRESKEWKTVYNSRTDCERLNKKVLRDYRLEHCRVQSDKHWFMRGFLISICLHFDAWLKNMDLELYSPLQLLTT